MASERRSSAEPGRVRYAVDTATSADVREHLARCDRHFQPPLSERVDIGAYAAKVRGSAVTFEAWAGDALVGLVGAYLNDPAGQDGWVTTVSVAPEFQGQGIGDALLGECLAHFRARAFRRVGLEVGEVNDRAIALYRRHGFVPGLGKDGLVKMTLDLEGR